MHTFQNKMSAVVGCSFVNLCNVCKKYSMVNCVFKCIYITTQTTRRQIETIIGVTCYYFSYFIIWLNSSWRRNLKSYNPGWNRVYKNTLFPVSSLIGTLPITNLMLGHVLPISQGNDLFHWIPLNNTGSVKRYLIDA
jgi:hypothetical protein